MVYSFVGSEYILFLNKIDLEKIIPVISWLTGQVR